MDLSVKRRPECHILALAALKGLALPDNPDFITPRVGQGCNLTAEHPVRRNVIPGKPDRSLAIPCLVPDLGTHVHDAKEVLVGESFSVFVKRHRQIKHIGGEESSGQIVGRHPQLADNLDAAVRPHHGVHFPAPVAWGRDGHQIIGFRPVPAGPFREAVTGHAIAVRVNEFRGLTPGLAEDQGRELIDTAVDGETVVLKGHFLGR